MAAYSYRSQAGPAGRATADPGGLGAVSPGDRGGDVSAARWCTRRQRRGGGDGIAGPGGSSADKPVGTVWIGWKRRGGYARAELFHFDGDRDAVAVRQTGNRWPDGDAQRARRRMASSARFSPGAHGPCIPATSHRRLVVLLPTMDLTDNAARHPSAARIPRRTHRSRWLRNRWLRPRKPRSPAPSASRASAPQYHLDALEAAGVLERSPGRRAACAFCSGRS